MVLLSDDEFARLKELEMALNRNNDKLAMIVRDEEAVILALIEENKSLKEELKKSNKIVESVMQQNNILIMKLDVMEGMLNENKK